MEDRVIDLVKEAKALNSKAISLHRLLILASLESLNQDGAAYRELKAGLEMKDGILYSNLKALCRMGYLEEKNVKVGNKELTSYNITQAGKEALTEARTWLKRL